MDYATYYAALIKPSFAPPEMWFGIAWGIIYPLIALAFVLLLKKQFEKKIENKTLMQVFVLNLIGNGLFTPVQFWLRSNVLASVVILWVLGTLGWFMALVYKESKLIFWLLMPYLLWVSFATVLQILITWMNL
jgi:tryptophan-rich sensory protein